MDGPTPEKPSPAMPTPGAQLRYRDWIILQLTLVASFMLYWSFIHLTGGVGVYSFLTLAGWVSVLRRFRYTRVPFTIHLLFAAGSAGLALRGGVLVWPAVAFGLINAFLAVRARRTAPAQHPEKMVRLYGAQVSLLLVWLPFAISVLCVLAGQEMGMYACYKSAYKAALEKPPDDFHSPKLEALATCHQSGSLAGAVTAAPVGYFFAWLAMRKARRWLALPLGVTAGLLAAALAGYLTGVP